MAESGRRDDTAELAHMDEVDAHPDVHRATEPDEAEVLRRLYGELDTNGIFGAES